MVLTLHIAHEGSHHYLARVFDGKDMVGDSTEHERIDNAIAYYGTEGGKRFLSVTGFSIWYGGWSIGNVSLDRMRADAAQLANRLVVLSAVLR